MSTHFTIDRGRIVEPRHLTLVVSNPWPTERDEDMRDRGGNPVGVAVILWLVCAVVLMGFIGWAAI